MQKWIKILKTFSINALIQTAREEKALDQKLTGTRSVNIALSYLIADMENDLLNKTESENAYTFSLIERLGLLFSVGDQEICIPADLAHEMIHFEKSKGNFLPIKDVSCAMGLLNWHEGLVPVLSVAELLNLNAAPMNSQAVVLILDIGKDLFGLVFNQFIQPIDWLEEKEENILNKRAYLDFADSLLACRTIRSQIFKTMQNA
ncbi:hypothetical protein COW36_21085 [bacterium (Candidatus Blackallbacteria) CG17_big_fil_post_rev_8_21_14_2_50_48_46]|uniref:CheW-like domain-containing protein n=1 Tax=bacterium (Candidatus Blackallbacteria) CG17_big_fil_post_rev_8_21_14_2_50_48_46 TaxID=2014261 RepID=A0A2M7FYW5_9BACT|nr:MAG: hypothetical protein COW64_14395 [bacterium (Candidatus Blackallbacteria) CG18_big_fil_WC_8_21_14_2_50_49_26]PIW14537.1 MAG: hypothetical protein COW36_21085 [bacterium (Candidatus Blackallbacteria) CG17_big_fil_post_rev_8_21_14_2_50_48_46]PIW47222.1 MAG: hypothetical protein COW20_13530 [bacterium (Candidatus Blackallbacteria) CG13_big_fil_rev_8_21_14_2_50_49_14]